jgi:RNA recognition motif-containing protein
VRGTRSKGYGFIALASKEAAEKAIELLNTKELDGREVMVELAKPSDQKDREKTERKPKRRPGRRGGKAVPGEVTESEANGEAGDAAKSEVPTDTATGDAAKPKRKKKQTSRKFKPKAEGDAAAPDGEGSTEAKKAPRTRKTATPRTPRPSRPAGEDPAGEPSKTMLFVANLGFNIDEAGLATLFTEAGIVVNSTRIIRRRWGQPRRSRGYGFVDVGTESEQQKAIDALSGKEVGGRAISVRIAVNAQYDDEADDKEGAENQAEVPAASAAA